METTALLPRDRKFLNDATNIVEDHLSEHDFNVGALCCYLGKSRVTAYRRLRKILNQSAGEFIRTLRLKRAERLMVEGGYSIHEAARMSGFNNLSWFSKCFRKKFGMSPSEFIRQASSSSSV
jgi:AraC-like DNA-binding protein